VATRWDDAVVDRLAERRENFRRGHARALTLPKVIAIALLVGGLIACAVLAARLA
jgi:hypothetical protein